MNISSAEFVGSATEVNNCPKAFLPEYAFIGRSNVGKSSLINLLTNRKELARTSGKPGKTLLINHFLINKNWHMVDLPGYGFAKIPEKEKIRVKKMINDYVLERKNLMCLFVLIDVRIEPQEIDIDFMKSAAKNEIPFVIIFTKCDKLKKTQLEQNISTYQNRMLKFWEETPQYFITSAETKIGREEILTYIEETNKLFGK